MAEFGLGQYEARAYVALLSGGTATAGELAYRAEIPRTKVYPVMMRLERKGLATVGGQKPVTCSAVPPSESLEEAIRAQIEKVNSMNALVSGLRAVSDGARRLRGAEERKYTHVGRPPRPTPWSMTPASASSPSAAQSS
ncbi:MAG: TrmB family transcriptional regulator [Thaumarchaeota archaeon S14]|nr:MAG: TrmB family transcriptional regulator [Thaumarchaeota archaeon S14]